MPTAVLYNMQGAKVGDVELSSSLFGAEVNKAVLHETVVNYLANQRQGTQSTKTRTEVAGGGAKPFRQKGTGRARQGSTRAPQWTHGGIVFAPKPRDYRFTVNKKVRRLALRSALSSKVVDNELIVLESLTLDEIKTSKMAQILANLGVTEKALIVLPENDKNVVLSARNMADVNTTLVNTMNTYDVMKAQTVVLTKDAVAKIEEVYA